MPSESPGSAPELFAISFAKTAEITTARPSDSESTNEEINRLRSELQSTVEEIQTSNEELKASNEEIMSINEELQSANEELETSKEEMQSLNEELITVNAQLRVKMEEHQAISSDLACLLTSTDVAVLFLDPEFRIRRFTPAAREMIDLIAGDVGRPLAALTRKFDDPHLDADCQSVLERLVPIGREVTGAPGKTYQRRVLPYRTADNRIDGVVITFVDITPRKMAENALAASEEQFRRAIEEAPIPVIMQAENGQVLLVSRTWTELTGYTVNDIPTADAWLNRLYGPGAEAVRTHMNELFHGDKKTFNVEFIIATRDRGERHWSFSASAPGQLHDGRKFVVGMALDVTERKRAEEILHKTREELETRVQQRTSELLQSSEQLRSVARELTLVEQRERRQLATTLHDQLQQLIVGARLRLDSLPSLNESDLAKETATIENLLSECLTVCRTLTAELSPPILYEEGLYVALEWLANWIAERHGLTVTLSKSADLPVLYNDVKILLFESVRELLFNVVKHSGVKAAEVLLDYDDSAQRLSVTVSDKGAGFDPARSAFRGRTPIGFGLFSIRERLKMVGGDLEIVSQPGKGSTISLILTLDKFNDLEDS